MLALSFNSRHLLRSQRCRGPLSTVDNSPCFPLVPGKEPVCKSVVTSPVSWAMGPQRPGGKVLERVQQLDSCLVRSLLARSWSHHIKLCEGLIQSPLKWMERHLLFEPLHRLPSFHCIRFKLFVLTFKDLHGTAFLCLSLIVSYPQ